MRRLWDVVFHMGGGFPLQAKTDAVGHLTEMVRPPMRIDAPSVSVSALALEPVHDSASRHVKILLRGSETVWTGDLRDVAALLRSRGVVHNCTSIHVAVQARLAEFARPAGFGEVHEEH